MQTKARNITYFPLSEYPGFQEKLFTWIQQFEITAFLDSNRYPDLPYGRWDCLAAAGAVSILECKAGNAFDQLKAFQTDWFFGFLGYDLKNEVERLDSQHFDGIDLPDLYFFQPATVVGIRHGKIEIHCIDAQPSEVLQQIDQQNIAVEETSPASVVLTPRMPKPQYLETIAQIREHIIAGDLYEMNVCQEFYAENVSFQPDQVFKHLNALAKAPFSVFFKKPGHALLCASPERFLTKIGDKLISQPIKGTRKRGENAETDQLIARELATSIKDRAENVMIVDLVRNDLTPFAQTGSIQVTELFKVYTFETVHQLISTVVAQLRPQAHPIDALRKAFPMGSMTGAPKVMAMQLIEQYECTRRGLYSGAFGYFNPEGDFDFNVVIRSILYNTESQYCSVQVGGAIVYDSDPEQEYEECMTKAKAMIQALAGQIRQDVINCA
jgi:para-aminobenzoate synthetase component 1